MALAFIHFNSFCGFRMKSAENVRFEILKLILTISKYTSIQIWYKLQLHFVFGLIINRHDKTYAEFKQLPHICIQKTNNI